MNNNSIPVSFSPDSILELCETRVSFSRCLNQAVHFKVDEKPEKGCIILRTQHKLFTWQSLAFKGFRKVFFLG